MVHPPFVSPWETCILVYILYKKPIWSQFLGSLFLGISFSIEVSGASTYAIYSSWLKPYTIDLWLALLSMMWCALFVSCREPQRNIASQQLYHPYCTCVQNRDYTIGRKKMLIILTKFLLLLHFIFTQVLDFLHVLFRGFCCFVTWYYFNFINTLS